MKSLSGFSCSNFSNAGIDVITRPAPPLIKNAVDLDKKRPPKYYKIFIGRTLIK